MSTSRTAFHRLLDAQLQACCCAPDPETLTRLVSPSIEDGQPAPALRFADPRVMALLACLCSYVHLFAGLTNRTLRPMLAELIPGYTAGQMTYDLRRLRRKGLIRRTPRSQRYELTAFGRRTAVFYTKTYVRILNPPSPSSTPTYHPRSPKPATSREHGERSSTRSTNESSRPLSRPEQLDSPVQPQTT